MNISDHELRAKYTEPKRKRVLGVILGRHEGKVIELINSIEIYYEIAKGSKQIMINGVYLHDRLQAYKKMYPTLDCLGWYSAGEDQQNDFPDNYDLELQ